MKSNGYLNIDEVSQHRCRLSSQGIEAIPAQGPIILFHIRFVIFVHEPRYSILPAVRIATDSNKDLWS